MGIGSFLRTVPFFVASSIAHAVRRVFAAATGYEGGWNPLYLRHTTVADHTGQPLSGHYPLDSSGAVASIEGALRALVIFSYSRVIQIPGQFASARSTRDVVAARLAFE